MPTKAKAGSYPLHCTSTSEGAATDSSGYSQASSSAHSSSQHGSKKDLINRMGSALAHSSLASMTHHPSFALKHLAERFVAPGRTQVILLAHSIAEKGARGVSHATVSRASITTTSLSNLRQVVCALVILTHAFILPYRAAFDTPHSSAPDARALDSSELAAYALSLYPLDLVFLALRIAPHLSRTFVERRREQAIALRHRLASTRVGRMTGMDGSRHGGRPFLDPLRERSTDGMSESSPPSPNPSPPGSDDGDGVGGGGVGGGGVGLSCLGLAG